MIYWVLFAEKENRVFILSKIDLLFVILIDFVFRRVIFLLIVAAGLLPASVIGGSTNWTGVGYHGLLLVEESVNSGVEALNGALQFELQ